MWNMMLWGLSSTSSSQWSHLFRLWQLYYLLRWFIVVHLLICIHFFLLRIVGVWLNVDIGCGERDWIWREAWWSWFLWDWRWWNKGWNTSESFRVPVFLCKRCHNPLFSEQYLRWSPILNACINCKPRLETWEQ